MKRITTLLLIAAFPGCSGMPIAGTEPADVVGACNTSYYNSDFEFGFDLPSTTTLTGQGTEPAFLFYATTEWFLLAPSVEASISAVVDEFPDSLAGLDDEAKLLSFAASRRESFAASPNTEFFTDMTVTLPNGDLGYMLILATDLTSPFGAEDRMVLYDVMTVKYNRVYWLSGFTWESVFTDTTHEVLSNVTLSLCVD